MRVKVPGQKLTVQAIAGTHVVMLGFDMDPADCDGLAGFAIHRTDPVEEEATWLRGLKTFAETDPGLIPPNTYSTRHHPIQGFTWADYAAEPGRTYQYRVVALKGPPKQLVPFDEVTVEVTTESPESGLHDIYFNRGSAGSQEYVRLFGNQLPKPPLPQAQLDWLSRGLYEAMIAFVERAQDATCELHVCAYEFHYEPVLEALKRAAADRNVAVRIIYDARKKDPREANDLAVQTVGIGNLCTRRVEGKSFISHNKFIVLSRNGQPEAVLTGSTNFSDGGIFGHSNVVHVVEDPEVAKVYRAYWDLLVTDPKNAALRPKVRKLYSLPAAIPAVPPDGAASVGRPPVGTGVIFSPRTNIDALQFYAGLAGEANDALFATFAFGMHPLFQQAYATGKARLRFALMEQPTRPMADGPEKQAEEAKIVTLRRQRENRFAIGGLLAMNLFDRWLAEHLTGLNKNVNFVHTKYMLLDPLGLDPIVVSGSANFSEASSSDNDENMLVIRGDSRVAEIYLGEFMRLYSHFAFREWASKPENAGQNPSHLRTDDWWRQYFGGTAQSRQRQYFMT